MVNLKKDGRYFGQGLVLCPHKVMRLLADWHIAVKDHSMVRLIYCIILNTVLGLWLLEAAGSSAQAQTATQVVLNTIFMEGDTQSLTLRLGLSRPREWRARLLGSPARLLIDIKDADFSALNPGLFKNALLGDVLFGSFTPGWARLVVALRYPMTLSEAYLASESDGVVITLKLEKTTPEAFAKAATVPEPPLWAEPIRIKPARFGLDLRSNVEKKTNLTVVLDPGHGGLDPGALAFGTSEAKMMLEFAFELKDLFEKAGVQTIMTRKSDQFVPLEARPSIARSHSADLLLSLHADALPLGEALGVTIYTMNDAASDRAAEVLAQRHDLDDLLAGVDLSSQDDQVTKALMAMARLETAPRTNRLAQSLKKFILLSGIEMYARPLQSAAFSVLKSPDIPSVLIELGFLTSKTDFSRLNDPVWREAMQVALVDGTIDWAKNDTNLRQYFTLH